MLDGIEGLLLITLTVSASIGTLLLLKHCWPNELRRQHNDLIGWHISVLGSTYAVIIGFMLFAVWSNFQQAEANTESEANSLVGVIRSARGLSTAQSARIRTLAMRYVENMLAEEWPAMVRGRVSPESQTIVEDLWTTITGSKTETPAEQATLTQTLQELSRMSEFRRQRELQVTASLPPILWAVLVVGATVTIVSACLFGTVDFRLHAIQVAMLALMISSVLVAIADINRPFQGAVHISTAAFERARSTMHARR